MSESDRPGNPMKQINRALGLFLLCFGIIVLVAVFFTETGVGKLTNAVAGGILTLIGGAMILKSKSGSSAS